MGKSTAYKAKKDELTTVLASIRDTAKAAEDADRDFTDDERTTVKSLVEKAEGLKNELLTLDEDSGLLAKASELSAVLGGTDDPVATITRDRAKSLGHRFTEAPVIGDWLKGINPTGNQPIGRGPSVNMGGLKDILAGGNTEDGPGVLVQQDWRGLLDMGTLMRPLRIRDVITVGQTDSDLVAYARITGFTNNAAPVPEARGVEPFVEGEGQVRGLKPQSSMTVEPVTTPVKTVAHWIPATKRALSDAAQLRTLIDAFLRYGLEEEVEDQVINGNGEGENFDGLLNTSGVQSQPFVTDELTTARKAITAVQTNGRADVTAFAMHPADDERIDLLKNNNGDFYFGGPASRGVQTLWGRPRVVSEAIPEGSPIAGDWRWAVLWDREQTTVQAFDQHADFAIRNLVAILAELRAAFGVVRPSAFCVFELEAGS